MFLQETRCTAEQVPAMEFAGLGYKTHAVGQTGGRNGVAVLSRIPFEVLAEALPGDAEDTQARYIEVAAAGIRAAGIYLPNGNPQPGPKFDYKLKWFDRLHARAADLMELEIPLVLAGDYNVIPTDADIANARSMMDDALMQPESRAAFRRLAMLGLTDALEARHPKAGLWTFWDYQAGAWQRNNGIRIDPLLLSPQAADRLKSVEIDKDMRAREKPSDHVPIRIELA